MHKSRLGTLIIDCEVDDLSTHAKFWSEALGMQPEPAERQTDPAYFRLEQHGDDVRVLLQKVDHPSRVHIDIETDDIEAEVRRLKGLGAEVVDRLEHWVVMQAPTGHRFCVIGPIREGFEQHANNWE